MRSTKEVFGEAFRKQTEAEELENAKKTLQVSGVKLDPNKDPRDQVDEDWFRAIK